MTKGGGMMTLGAGNAGASGKKKVGGFGRGWGGGYGGTGSR